MNQGFFYKFASCPLHSVDLRYLGDLRPAQISRTPRVDWTYIGHPLFVFSHVHLWQLEEATLTHAIFAVFQ